MPKICLIIGYPYSGKHFLAEECINFADEIVHNCSIKAIEHHLQVGKDLIITSDICCDKKRRRSYVKELKGFGYEVMEVYLAKVPSKCEENAKFCKKELDLSNFEYNLPYGQKTIQIYDYSKEYPSGK